MKRFLATLVLLGSAACGIVPDFSADGRVTIPPPLSADVVNSPHLTINGSSEDIFFTARVLEAYQRVQINPALNLQAISIFVGADITAVYCRIADGSTDGCTWQTPGHINIAVSYFWTPEKNAELLAHELGHAFAMEHCSPYDGDPEHTHGELFARPSGEYASYPGEIGVATEVANYFTEGFEP